MSIVTKLSQFLKPGQGTASRSLYTARLRCRRCGEELEVRVNLVNDLSIDYERNVYTVRKLVSGSGANRCFQTIELWLTFDENRKLVSREVTGGEFVDDEPEQPVEQTS